MMRQPYKQINILNEIFSGQRGTAPCTPDAWNEVQTVADLLTNRLDEIKAESVTTRDARLLAKRLIGALEDIPADGLDN